jgi:hypothetical protein
MKDLIKKYRRLIQNSVSYWLWITRFVAVICLLIDTISFVSAWWITNNIKSTVMIIIVTLLLIVIWIVGLFCFIVPGKQSRSTEYFISIYVLLMHIFWLGFIVTGWHWYIIT